MKIVESAIDFFFVEAIDIKLAHERSIFMVFEVTLQYRLCELVLVQNRESLSILIPRHNLSVVVVLSNIYQLYRKNVV